MPQQEILSEYKRRLADEERKEFPCGIRHRSLEEAMVHAERNLGFRDAHGKLKIELELVLGSMFGEGTVVGWQHGPRRRFRVDFDPDFLIKNAEAAKEKEGVNKGMFGVHVNEEDFTRTTRPKLCHPTDSSLIIAELLWRRWSSKYGRKGQITAKDIRV